jgi:hypothetical protein
MQMRLTQVQPSPLVRVLFAALLATAAVTAVRAGSGPPPLNPAQGDPANAPLAERFAQMASLNLATHEVDEVSLRESSALLEAAARLNPAEPRFQRLLVEAKLRLRDPDGAIQALRSYLNALGRNSDRQAEIQLLDLYASQMQKAEDQLAFYQDKANLQGLAAEVRSHAATKAAQLLRDRGDDAAANQMLDQALRTNALNIDALWMHYDRAVDSGGAYERVAALVALLRANPTNPDVMARLAAELADAGLPAESLTWYGNSFALANRAGRSLDPVAFIDSTAEAFLAGQIRQADSAVSQVLQSDPGNVDAWYVKLLCARSQQDKEGFDKALESARAAMLERLYAVHRAMNNGADPPGTQPTGELSTRLPRLDEDVQKLKQPGTPPELKQAYEQALTDLSWLELYFAEKPNDAAPLIQALSSLLPPDNVTIPRLEGWSFLLNKKPDEAKVKLSAVADRDPLAKMGLLRLEWSEAENDPDVKDRIRSQARELVNKNASGLLGAVLFDGLREQGGAVIAANNAEAIKEVLTRFPKAWLDIIDKPQQFYTVMIEPLKVSHGFDEPMLAVLTIKNMSDSFDLTIGPNGVIRPDLWFDAIVLVPQKQQIPGAGYDRIAKAVLLRPGQSTNQIVRLDQGRLSELINQVPRLPVQLQYSVVINPAPGPQAGMVVPGPAGLRVQVRTIVERAATPVTRPNLMRDLANAASDGEADVKLRTLSQITALVREVSQPQAPQQTKDMARPLMDIVDQGTRDASPGVRAWANFLWGALQPPEKQLDSLKKLAASDSWIQQMLVLSAAPDVPRDMGKEIDAMLLDASDPLVKKYAQAVAEELKRPPATRPSTQPGATTGPAAAATP